MRAMVLPLCLAALGSAVACGPAKPADSPSHDVENASPPPPAATPPPPPVEAVPAPGSGVPYDKDAVETVVKRAAIQVKANCGAATDEDGKANGPWGKTTATVKLGHNGHSKGATVPPPYDGKPVGKCIHQAFAILIYPPFAGPDVTLDWPVEVVQPAAPAP